MTQHSVSNPATTRNGNHVDPAYQPNGEAHDAWKREHPKYIGWRQ